MAITHKYLLELNYSILSSVLTNGRRGSLFHGIGRNPSKQFKWFTHIRDEYSRITMSKSGTTAIVGQKWFKSVFPFDSMCPNVRLHVRVGSGWTRDHRRTQRLHGVCDTQ